MHGNVGYERYICNSLLEKIVCVIVPKYMLINRN